MMKHSAENVKVTRRSEMIVKSLDRTLVLFLHAFSIVDL